MEENDAQQLSSVTAGFMLAVAICVDVIQFFVGFLDIIFIGTPINWGINLGVWLSYYIWFKSHGIKFVKPKRFFAFGLGPIIEFIPIINALPAWTLAIIIILGTIKAEKVIAEKVPGGKAVSKGLGTGQRQMPERNPQGKAPWVEQGNRVNRGTPYGKAQSMNDRNFRAPESRAAWIPQGNRINRVSPHEETQSMDETDFKAPPEERYRS